MSKKSKRNGRKPTTANGGSKTTTVAKQKGPSVPNAQSSNKRPQAGLSISSTNKSPVANVTETPVYKVLCGLTNPFCQAARGSKYPDISAVATLPYTLHTLSNLTTDASGNAAKMHFASFYFSAALATVAGTTATYVTASAASTGLSPSSTRVVSMGLRLRNIISPLNSSGMVSIRAFAAPNGIALGATDLLTYSCDFYADIPLSAINNNGHTDVIFRKTDMDSQRFLTSAEQFATAAVVDYVSPGWVCVQIGIVGGPVSIAALSIETFQHNELTFLDNDALQLLATPAPAAHPVLQAMASKVSKHIGNVFNTVAEDVERVAVNNIRAVLFEQLRGPATTMLLSG
jgi:hypothetical protein